MNSKTQAITPAGANPALQPTTLVGMDAHSRKIELCITRWQHGAEPTVLKRLTTTLDALEHTYARQVPADALTVLEASTNAFSIARRLEQVGHRVEVLASDTLAGQARADRINDRIDAQNLAAAYARGGVRRVHVPSARHQQWRDLLFGYRSAVKESVRWSHRIWAFGRGRGLKLPRQSLRRKSAAVRQDVLAHGWTQDETFLVETLLLEYEHSLALRARYEQRIVRIVTESPEMTRLMQQLGVGFIVAFALVAIVEDVHRFANPKKLTSYIGLNPTVLKSGESEGPRAISHYGRRDLKTLMVQAAQCVLRKGSDDMAKWAHRRIASGKNRNVVVCALARKLSVRAWHILMGHPVPDRGAERSFRLKLAKLAAAAGREHLEALGYKKPADYIEAVCARIYPLETQEELQTDAPASA